MRLYEDPPLEGGGARGVGEEAALYQSFVKHILYLNCYIPAPSPSVQNNTYYTTALGPNRLRTTPPVCCTLPMPRHTSNTTDFNL